MWNVVRQHEGTILMVVDGGMALCGQLMVVKGELPIQFNRPHDRSLTGDWPRPLGNPPPRPWHQLNTARRSNANREESVASENCKRCDRTQLTGRTAQAHPKRPPNVGQWYR